MQSFKRVVAITAALTLSAFAPDVARAQSLPQASEIITKYVAAIGGKSEVMKVRSIKQTASMELPSAGIKGDMEMYSAAPNKVAMKTSISGLGEMQQGYNGSVAWDVNPMQGPRLLADKELAITVDGADFYANLLYAPEGYASMETVGDTTINGEKAYKVKMVRKATKKESFSYFSASTGLLVANLSTSETQMGVMMVMSTMGDYKPFGGVMMPTKLEQQSGPQKIVVTIKDVTINAVPDSAFAIPANVKPLIKP